MSLPVVQRAAHERDAAVLIELDGAQFLVRRGGDFEIATEADAPKPSLLFRLLSSLRKILVIGYFQSVLENTAEVPRVVRHIGRGLVRHLVAADVVAPAKLQAVDAHLH